jgi:hypothetical protein
MDTRFWGPSGWKLLHSISFLYDPKHKDDTSEFLATLPFILPCKFCRHSLTCYYKEYPYENNLNSRKDFEKWMYTIHNCVNNKLRKQGLNPTNDPTFNSVTTFYRKWLSKGVTSCVLSTFWDFLFSVAYNHPKEASKHSLPMPDCPPEAVNCKDPNEKNKWNTMLASERMPYYRRFWELLPVVMPVFKWNEAPNITCRKSTIAWLWRQRCAIEPDNKDPYRDVCTRIASYASGCGTSKRARTCRKKPTVSKTRKVKKHN